MTSLTFRLLVLFNIVFLLSIEVNASPCVEVRFHYENSYRNEIPDQDIRLKWSYNKRCSGFGQRSNLFILEFTDIEDRIISTDTVTGFEFTIKRERFDSNGLTIIYLKELGDDSKYHFFFKTTGYFETPEFSNKAEEINFLLGHGYFLYAFEKIHQLNRPDLKDQFEKQYEILFPENYPGNTPSFNAYLPEDLSEFKIMAFVSGFEGFLEILNKKTKKEYIKAPGYEIKLIISSENQIVRFETDADSKKELFRSLLDKLTFDNPHSTARQVVIKIGRTSKGKKYIIHNKRMLSNPKSAEFKKVFGPKGAIH